MCTMSADSKFVKIYLRPCVMMIVVYFISSHLAVILALSRGFVCQHSDSYRYLVLEDGHTFVHHGLAHYQQYIIIFSVLCNCMHCVPFVFMSTIYCIVS